MKGVLEMVGRIPGAERALVGFRSGFATREEADRCAARYGFQQHEHPNAIKRQLAVAESARPSDYAALFHLQQLLPTLGRVIDLGGSVGNLFYCYSQYLDFPEDFRWVVVEIAPVAEAGTALAQERGATKLRFATNLAEAAAHDDGKATLFLVSGALHYFDTPLGTMLTDAGLAPEHAIVNRSPVSEAGSVFGIQDGGKYVTTARMLDRRTLLTSMEQAGYRLQDEWIAAELNMRIPLRPSKSVESYSGLLFSRQA
jgi:putative methyltransferase (TIGR04325 family)